jgi:hypothetical protein
MSSPVQGLSELDAFSMVHKFYLLDAMEAFRGNGAQEWRPTENHGHMNFAKSFDFALMKRDLARKSGPAVASYLALMLAKDLYHGTRRDYDHWGDDRYGPVDQFPDWIRHAESGEEIIERAQSQGLSYEQFGKLAADLFRKPGWNPRYGGGKWAEIAETLSEYRPNNPAGYLPDIPEIWLDHVFDLDHNTGSLFTKSPSVGREGGAKLKAFLTFKEEGKYEGPMAMVEFIERQGYSAPIELESIAQRGRNLGVW